MGCFPVERRKQGFHEKEDLGLGMCTVQGRRRKHRELMRRKNSETKKASKELKWKDADIVKFTYLGVSHHS